MDDTYIAVIGGRRLSASAGQMARLVGYHLIDSDCILITDGKAGAGEAASHGALEACLQKGIEPKERVFSYFPNGRQPAFQIGTQFNKGQSKLESWIAMIQSSWGAIVVGGGKETVLQIRLAVLQAIVEGYNFIPASGTGGEAERICAAIPAFEDDILNDPLPSAPKTLKLIERVRQSPCWYCDIDIVKAHDDWFVSSDRNPVAAEIFRIRHKYF